MGRLLVEHGVLRESAAVTSGVARDMADARSVLGGRADGLLGSGWSGPAASAFRSAMDEWDTGAGEVITALERLGDLIAVADRGFAATDTTTSGALETAGSGLPTEDTTASTRGSAAGGGGGAVGGVSRSSGSARFASGLNM